MSRMSRVGFTSVVVLLLAGTAISFHRPSNLWADASVTADGSRVPARSASTNGMKKFDCLPKDVQLDEVVSYGKTADGNVTVEKKLREIKARCRHGKLVDKKKKEIRFFRVSCWGNPPPDYLEIQQREHAELQKLKRRYTVIVMTCNPRTA